MPPRQPCCGGSNEINTVFETQQQTTRSNSLVRGVESDGSGALRVFRRLAIRRPGRRVVTAFRLGIVWAAAAFICGAVVPAVASSPSRRWGRVRRGRRRARSSAAANKAFKLSLRALETAAVDVPRNTGDGIFVGVLPDSPRAPPRWHRRLGRHVTCHPEWVLKERGGKGLAASSLWVPKPRARVDKHPRRRDLELRLDCGHKRVRPLRNGRGRLAVRRFNIQHRKLASCQRPADGGDEVSRLSRGVSARAAEMIRPAHTDARALHPRPIGFELRVDVAGSFCRLRNGKAYPTTTASHHSSPIDMPLVVRNIRTHGLVCGRVHACGGGGGGEEG
jgi:hypothetical protein